MSKFIEVEVVEIVNLWDRSDLDDTTSERNLRPLGRQILNMEDIDYIQEERCSKLVRFKDNRTGTESAERSPEYHDYITVYFKSRRQQLTCSEADYDRLKHCLVVNTAGGRPRHELED